MTENEINQPLVLKWPEFENEKLVDFYNEIKQNKKLKLEWENPGRLDPELVEKFRKEQQKKLNESNQADNLVDMNQDELADANNEANKFDLFDEFSSELEKEDNQKLDLRITHKPRESNKKVATMDKILDDMRKTYEYEQSNINLFPINPTFDENDLMQAADETSKNNQDVAENSNQKVAEKEETAKMDIQNEEQPVADIETKTYTEELNLKEQAEPVSIVEDQSKQETQTEISNLVQAPQEECSIQHETETVNKAEAKAVENNPSNLNLFFKST